MNQREWEDSLPVVRLELHPHAIMNKVFVNGEEWAASVKALSIDIDHDKMTRVTLSFYAKVTVEGHIPLKPWPIIVESGE